MCVRCGVDFVVGIQECGQKIPFMVDSGVIVNFIPRKIAIELDLEVVEVEITMQGIDGEC